VTRRELLLLAASLGRATDGFAQEPAKPQLDSNAGRDTAVLNAVLVDLLTWPDSPLRPRDATKKQINFSLRSPDFQPKASDILSRHDQREWDKLSPAQLGLAREAAADLVRRVERKDKLQGLKLKDKRIVVAHDSEAVAKRERKRRRVRPQVFRAFAPGYSRDGKIAIVRLNFPWSIHSGYATYVLAWKESEFLVLMRDVVIHL
jgi:hypothetical protein